MTASDKLNNWLAAFLVSLKQEKAAARTIQTQENNLNYFVKWCDSRGLRHGRLLTSSTVLDYQYYLHQHQCKNGQPYSVRTQNNYLSSLRAFARWCCETQRMKNNMCAVLKMPKMGLPLPVHVFTSAQLQRFLHTPNIRTPLGVRNRAILEIAAATGLTGRELASLRLAEIEAATGLITVRPLERGDTRTIPIGNDAGRWLRQYLTEARPALCADRDHDTAMVFVSQWGKAIQGGDVSHVARETARKAGLPHTGVLATLKASLAVFLLENNCDPRFLAALFGHADLQSVKKYQRMNVKRLQEMHSRFHPAEQQHRDR